MILYIFHLKQIKIVLPGMIDAYANLSVVEIVTDGSTATAFAAAERGWIVPYGAPVRIWHDRASIFNSAEWVEK